MIAIVGAVIVVTGLAGAWLWPALAALILANDHAARSEP